MSRGRISTDIIVGFPGEEVLDFKETLKVLDIVKYDTVYSFIYSPRPNTLSFSWGDRECVPLNVAKERLRILQENHREILQKNSKKELNKIHKVLIDNNKDSLLETYSEGRSDTNRLIKIKNDFIDIGEIVNVKVVEVVGSTLYAVRLTNDNGINIANFSTKESFA